MTVFLEKGLKEQVQNIAALLTLLQIVQSPSTFFPLPGILLSCRNTPPVRGYPLCLFDFYEIFA